jgi:uncharacterized protein YbjT (DUF2867 family)
MKIVVIGGTGLIGSKLVTKLGGHGHEIVAASPDTGVNTLTGEGLADALVGASVVIDVSNSPSFEDSAVMKFFETSTRNLLAAEALAGVAHHVALSVVGTERLPESGYFRAKLAQEQLIENSSIPYSIVHATQFFEFVGSIADGGTVRVAPVLFQPIAGDDVAQAVGRISIGSPLNGRVEVAGPERFRMDEFFREALAARNDPREVVTDPHARYFGAELSEGTLVPAGDAILAETRYSDWPDRTVAGRQHVLAGRRPALIVAEVPHAGHRPDNHPVDTTTAERSRPGTPAPGRRRRSTPVPHGTAATAPAPHLGRHSSRDHRDDARGRPAAPRSVPQHARHHRRRPTRGGVAVAGPGRLRTRRLVRRRPTGQLRPPQRPEDHSRVAGARGRSVATVRPEAVGADVVHR